MSKIELCQSQDLVELPTGIYLIKCGPDGHLCVSFATLNSGFTMVDVDDSSPVPINRHKFVCVKKSDTSFLVLGGNSEDLTEFEIWKFNVEKKMWKKCTNISEKEIKLRSGHDAIFSPLNNKVLYVFGGQHGYELCNTLVVITFLKESSYSYMEFEHDKYPVPRVSASMVTYRNSIWIFGGIDAKGKKLNDLWEMEHSIMDLTPRWIQYNPEPLPPPRDSHITWVNNHCIYIAGGIGDKNQKLNDIWEFNKDCWKQTMIYESDFSIFYCSSGLCEVSDTLKLANQRSPFAGLDGLFNKLKMRQKDYSQQANKEEKNLSELRKQLSQLKVQCEGLEKYSKDNIKTKEVQDIIDMFSNERRKKLFEQTHVLREQLSMNTKKIISNLPSVLETESLLLKPKTKELVLQLSIKAKQDEQNLQKIKENRELEISLYKQQIEKLEQSSGVTKTVNIDPSDFSTFQSFAENLQTKEKNYALNLYYGMQLRAYQQYISESKVLKKKLEKIEKKQAKYIEIINQLSNKLSKKFQKVSVNQEELENWKKYSMTAEEDCSQVKSYLDAIDKYRQDSSNIDENAESLVKQNQEIQEKLNNKVNDVVNLKKETIEKLYKMTFQLNEAIKSQTPEESHNLINEALPEMNYYLSLISNDN